MYAAREYCFAFNGDEMNQQNKQNNISRSKKKHTQEKWDCNNNPMEGGRNL